VWIVVKHDPETVAFVHRCDEQTISMILLYYTRSVAIHEVVKAILRLRRDWCDVDDVHGRTGRDLMLAFEDLD